MVTKTVKSANTNNSELPAKRTTHLSMADLMAGYTHKQINLHKGDQVQGKVIVVNKSDVVVDLGGKTEGVLDKKELVANGNTISVGDSLSAFVISSENESGQIILSLRPDQSGFVSRADYPKRWQKFVMAKGSGTNLTGRVSDINKGGLMVEIDGTRGFLPTSQVRFDIIAAAGERGGLNNLVGQDIAVKVIEVDPSSNRLIFSNRSSVGEDTLKKLEKYQPEQQVKGKVVAVAPLGLFVKLEEGVEGLVLTYETSWSKADLTESFQVGQEVEAKITGIDKEMGRVGLSLRQLSEDPFEKLSENFQTDDVVKGAVANVSASGVNVLLTDGVEGFLPAAKFDPSIVYQMGQAASFLVDSVDKQKRRIILTPFITSTKDLIYK